MEIDLLIFDLDGTLIDSQGDVGFALNRLLGDFGIAAVPPATIRKHVGYGVKPLMEELLRHRGVDDLAAAFDRFTEYYLSRCSVDTALFPGVEASLQRLSGFPKTILTNKSNRFIGKILADLRIDHHFESHYGRESFARQKPDPLPIQMILREYGVAPGRCLIVGDTETDVHAGERAGIKTCLVSYGYGTPSVLEKLEPTFRIDRLEDLPALLERSRVNA